MMPRRLALISLSSTFLSIGMPGAPAWADDVRVMESAPAASAVIEGRSSEFFVRFDRPVDHIRSTLDIMRDGKVVERLKPRLESAPTVLFARAPTLSPGNYTLRWSVRTMAGAETKEGDIPFTVKGQP